MLKRLKLFNAAFLLTLVFAVPCATTLHAQEKSKNYKEAIYNMEPKFYDCAKIEVITDNLMGSTVKFENKWYQDAVPQTKYQLKITNMCYFDTLAHVAVDNLNVLTGLPMSSDSPGFILPRNTYYLISSKIIEGKPTDLIFKDMDKEPELVMPSATNSVSKIPEVVAPIKASFYKEYEFVGVSEEEREKIQSMPGGSGLRNRPPVGPLREIKEIKITTPLESKGIFSVFSKSPEPVVFERENAKPFKSQEIFYDSRENLVSRGILK